LTFGVASVKLVDTACILFYTRGETRLDCVRGKKQVWRPDVRTRGLSEANVLLKKALVTLLGLFGVPAVIRRPGNCAPLAPPRYASVLHALSLLVIVAYNVSL